MTTPQAPDSQAPAVTQAPTPPGGGLDQTATPTSIQVTAPTTTNLTGQQPDQDGMTKYTLTASADLVALGQELGKAFGESSLALTASGPDNISEPISASNPMTLYVPQNYDELVVQGVIDTHDLPQTATFAQVKAKAAAGETLTSTDIQTALVGLLGG